MTNKSIFQFRVLQITKIDVFTMTDKIGNQILYWMLPNSIISQISSTKILENIPLLRNTRLCVLKEYYFEITFNKKQGKYIF